jgi:transcription initiation factor TFIIA large subunit
MNQAVSALYKSIIEEVVTKCSAEFQNSGYEDNTLQDLKNLWIQKLEQQSNTEASFYDSGSTIPLNNSGRAPFPSASGVNVPSFFPSYGRPPPFVNLPNNPAPTSAIHSLLHPNNSTHIPSNVNMLLHTGYQDRPIHVPSTAPPPRLTQQNTNMNINFPMNVSSTNHPPSINLPPSGHPSNLPPNQLHTNQLHTIHSLQSQNFLNSNNQSIVQPVLPPLNQSSNLPSANQLHTFHSLQSHVFAPISSQKDKTVHQTNQPSNLPSTNQLHTNQLHTNQLHTNQLHTIHSLQSQNILNSNSQSTVQSTATTASQNPPSSSALLNSGILNTTQAPPSSLKIPQIVTSSSMLSLPPRETAQPVEPQPLSSNILLNAPLPASTTASTSNTPAKSVAPSSTTNAPAKSAAPGSTTNTPAKSAATTTTSTTKRNWKDLKKTMNEKMKQQDKDETKKPSQQLEQSNDSVKKTTAKTQSTSKTPSKVKTPVQEKEDSDEDLGIGEDSDDSEEPETDNLIICTFEKVSRVKSKWKMNLKCGVMNINGRDYLFNRATGEGEWS